MIVWLRRIVAGYEIITGGIGIVGFALTMQAVSSGVVPVDVFLVLMTAAVFSVIAGVQLWRGRRNGIRWSLTVQALQIVTLSVPRFAYSLGLTFRSEVGWRGERAPALPINHFLLRVGSNEYGPMLGVNFPALVAFAITWYLLFEERHPATEGAPRASAA